jgi:predicted butyrate kinase (DUF1464 family)
VVGIDAGTVSFDLCGLENGRVFAERSLPTGEALADPAGVVSLLESLGPLDLIAGPSGYGLPLKAARELTEDDLTLAFLAGPGEAGGIGGLKALLRALAASALPVVLTPGVIHLDTVPAYRKVNRVDMGTADKVCAAAVAIHEIGAGDTAEPSFILLELGGAFTAALAVEHGQIVDGLGGTSGPLGARAAGALDGEVAFLAGGVSKDLLFTGGVASIGGEAGWDAYRDGANKAIAAMMVSAPSARTVVLSGRHAGQLRLTMNHRSLSGFPSVAKTGALGAALIADGLAGGAAAGLVDRLGIRAAAGTILDHLFVITPGRARARLGIGA